MCVCLCHTYLLLQIEWLDHVSGRVNRNGRNMKEKELVSILTTARARCDVAYLVVGMDRRPVRLLHDSVLTFLTNEEADQDVAASAFYEYK